MKKITRWRGFIKENEEKKNPPMIIIKLEISFDRGYKRIPVKPGADTERLLLRSGIGAIACGRLRLWATPWLLRGQADYCHTVTHTSVLILVLVVNCFVSIFIVHWGLSCGGGWEKKTDTPIELLCSYRQEDLTIKIYGNIVIVFNFFKYYFLSRLVLNFFK